MPNRRSAAVAEGATAGDRGELMKARLVLLALIGAVFAIPGTARAACQPILNPLGGTLATVCNDQYQSGSSTYRNASVTSGTYAVSLYSTQSGGSVQGLDGYMQVQDSGSQSYVTNYYVVTHNTTTGQTSVADTLYGTSYSQHRQCTLQYQTVQDDVMYGDTGATWHCYQI
jgi:hypothetical protein